MRRKMLSVAMVAVLAITSLVGCGNGSSKADKEQVKIEAPKEVFGDTIQYDPSVEINDGKDVTLELWEWGSDELFEQLIAGYTEIHPNVTINVINNPWDGFFTKLPLALQRDEEGPTLFNIHNSYEHLLLNYIEPYDISTDDLIADYPSASTHLMDGNIYYMDYGLSTGMFYYNKTKTSGRKPD